MSNTSKNNDYNCEKVSSKCHGFRLGRKRLSIQRICSKFSNLVGAFNLKCRSTCRWLDGGIVTSARRICGSSCCTVCKCQTTAAAASSVDFIGNGERTSACRLKSVARTNSFYTEAIADCLEFIKRSSVSVDHDRD